MYDDPYYFAQCMNTHKPHLLSCQHPKTLVHNMFRVDKHISTLIKHLLSNDIFITDACEHYQYNNKHYIKINVCKITKDRKRTISLTIIIIGKKVLLIIIYDYLL